MKLMIKPCGLFETMCDIVLEWAKRNKIEISVKAMNDLRSRLSNAHNTLKNKFTCTKANRIELETIE